MHFILLCNTFYPYRHALVVQSQISLPPGPGAAVFFNVSTASIDGTRSVLVADVVDADGTLQSSNLLPLVVPGDMVLPQANIDATVAKVSAKTSRVLNPCPYHLRSNQAPNPDGSVTISISSDSPALWFTLTTLAQVGRLVTIHLSLHFVTLCPALLL